MAAMPEQGGCSITRHIASVGGVATPGVLIDGASSRHQQADVGAKVNFGDDQERIRFMSRIRAACESWVTAARDRQ